MDVEQRARELLAALVKIRDSTFRDAAALRGIADMAINADHAGDFRSTSLTPPEGCVLVPVIPAYEMVKALADTAGCNLAHAALAYRDALAARPEVKP